MMKPAKNPTSRRRTRTPSPPKAHRNTDSVDELFEELQISVSSSEPRSFPYSVKQQCWDKAEKVKGRDPDRWRKDPIGNIVFRKFVGCPGCMCHDYDHIVPYSKGGKSTLDNCHVLQICCGYHKKPHELFLVKSCNTATVNRSKGNKTELSRADLIQRSTYCRVSGRDMDLIEISAFGNIRHGQDSGGCRIQ